MNENGMEPMNRRRRNLSAVFVVLLGFMCLRATAQIRIDGTPLLVSRSSRGESLGYSYVSETREATGMYWNAAMLAFTPSLRPVIGAYQLWDYSQLSVYGAIPVRLLGRHTFGIGYTQTALGREWTAPQFVGRTLDLAYTYRVSEVFSIGALVNLVHGQTWSSELLTGAASIGLFYLPTSGMRYGFAFEGLGTGINYAQYKLYPIRHQTKVLRMGISYTYPVVRKEKLVTMTITGEKWYGIASLHYYMGLEITPLKFVAFRMGYASKPESSVDYSSGARFGIGILTKYFEIDYCVSPSRSAGQHQQFTLLSLIP